MTRIVAFGLGSVILPGGDFRSVCFQHAALLIPREILLEKLNLKEIPIYLQDPGYLENDVKFTKEHKMTVVIKVDGLASTEILSPFVYTQLFLCMHFSMSVSRQRLISQTGDMNLFLKTKPASSLLTTPT
jgi:hypothetical protein